MKTNFLRKAKWYIVGFILIAIMLSVSLSFSAWDTLSVKAVLENKGSGGYELKWNDYIKKSNGESYAATEYPKVGDIVTYGNFYKASGATETEAQKWIVVDYNSTTKVATLLTEQVVVYGNYWGKADGAGDSEKYLNDYYRSTVRSWLNSGKGSLMGSGTTWKDTERYNDNVRNDGLNGGKPFGENESQVNKGFLDVAFTGGAETLLVPKSISGMKYYDISKGVIDCTTTPASGSRASINDLVWLPSSREIFGSTHYYNEPLIDIAAVASSEKFSYFNDSQVDIATGSSSIKAKCGATDYAWNNGSGISYCNASGTGGGTSNNDAQSAAWWWLRSPHPSSYGHALRVGSSGSSNLTYYSSGGVRPAVNVQL